MEKVFDNNTALEVSDLVIGYGDRIVLQDLNFSVNRGEIFAIMGGSGCGKSTLLKHIIGIYPVKSGTIKIFDRTFDRDHTPELDEVARLFGVTYQGGALLGSMTLAQNVALVLEEHTRLSKSEINDIVMEKLSQVNLEQFAGFYPSQISGGMKKRAGLARALALDPPLLFFDEPSAGLDPISSAELDRLIMRLRDEDNRTVVIVTHELDSIFTIADNVIMLDKNTKSIIERGDPRIMKTQSQNPWVREFLNRSGLAYEKNISNQR